MTMPDEQTDRLKTSIRQAVGMGHVGRTEFKITTTAFKKESDNWWLVDLPTVYKHVEFLIAQETAKAVEEALIDELQQLQSFGPGDDFSSQTIADRAAARLAALQKARQKEN